ncbi:hypothetical protein CCP3SC15_5950002 [Gammaproteobacteria bacterium]
MVIVSIGRAIRFGGHKDGSVAEAESNIPTVSNQLAAKVILGGGEQVEGYQEGGEKAQGQRVYRSNE